MHVRYVIETDVFKGCVNLMIAANTVLLSMEYYGMSHSFESKIGNLCICVCVVFIICVYASFIETLHLLIYVSLLHFHRGGKFHSHNLICSGNVFEVDWTWCHRVL